MLYKICTVVSVQVKKVPFFPVYPAAALEAAWLLDSRDRVTLPDHQKPQSCKYINAIYSNVFTQQPRTNLDRNSWRALVRPS